MLSVTLGVFVDSIVVLVVVVVVVVVGVRVDVNDVAISGSAIITKTNNRIYMYHSSRDLYKELNNLLKGWVKSPIILLKVTAAV